MTQWRRGILIVLVLNLVVRGVVKASRVYAQSDATTNQQALPPGDWREPLKKRLGDWRKKLEEFHQGKRDNRDGYIILHKMSHLYAVLREQNSSEAQATARQKDELLKTYPQFRSLEDYRLSDEIASVKQAESSAERIKEEAMAWTPADDHPLYIIRSGTRAIVRYQFHLAFIDISDGLTIGIGPGEKLEASRRGTLIDANSLRPDKVLSFRHSIETVPRGAGEIKERFIVCTSPGISHYSAVSPREQELIRARGHTGSMPWENPRGKYQDFCGIVSQHGSILFQFPLRQRSPDLLLTPLDISPDENRVAVALGEVVTSDEATFVGNPRGIWVWERGRGLRKFPVKDRTQTVWDLRRRFLAGEF